MNVRCLLDQDLAAIVDVHSPLRRLIKQTAAIEGEVGIFHLTSSIFHQEDAILFIAEVEVDGLDLLTGSEVQLEVGAEGIDGHAGAGVVEGVACSEIEDVAVGTGEWLGIVGAYEGYAWGDYGTQSAADSDTGEGWIHDILTAILPLDDVGLACFDGIHLCEIEREGP